MCVSSHFGKDIWQDHNKQRVNLLRAPRRLRSPPIPQAAKGRPQPAARGLCATKFAHFFRREFAARDLECC
jgi:hypothetical protein